MYDKIVLILVICIFIFYFFTVASHLTFNVDRKKKYVYDVINEEVTVNVTLTDFDLTNNIDLGVSKVSHQNDNVRNISRPLLTVIPGIKFQVYPMNERKTLKQLFFKLDNIDENKLGQYILKIENRYSFDIFTFYLAEKGES